MSRIEINQSLSTLSKSILEHFFGNERLDRVNVAKAKMHLVNRWKVHVC